MGSKSDNVWQILAGYNNPCPILLSQLRRRKLFEYSLNPKKKTEISLNNRATPPTRERAKRADQHVYASARKIRKINIMTLNTQ